MSIIEIQNVQYAYDEKKKVLKGINAQMEQGMMYAKERQIAIPLYDHQKGWNINGKRLKR